MKALIIGAAGFVGGYLADYLQKECGWSVAATKLEKEVFQKEVFQRKEVLCYNLDILDAKAVQELLQMVEPDFVFHLAAQSSVALSWENPDLTLNVNIQGCVHVLEAIRKLPKKPRILLVGSSEEYGSVDTEEAITETQVLCPKNIYAASKVCQNMLGAIYAHAYQMEVVMVRAFNHIGPGQAPIFVVSDFCRQVAEIEAGKREAVIRVGNLSAKRDFTDVRDIVRAYALLIQKGRSGETYNVGSGQVVSIQEVLERILLLSKQKIRVETDPKKLRPVDVPVMEADIQKLKQETGWERQIALVDTLEETLCDWRCILQQEEKRN